jgi:hypothetical protein
MAVTLEMMSNSSRSSPVLTNHLPIDQGGRTSCSDPKEFEINYSDLAAVDIRLKLVI